jgi:hypothetical protein
LVVVVGFGLPVQQGSRWLYQFRKDLDPSPHSQPVHLNQRNFAKFTGNLKYQESYPLECL